MTAPEHADRAVCDPIGLIVDLVAAVEHQLEPDRIRAEDRIRAARATGLTNLPLHDTAQNQVWLEIVQIALDLPAWMPMRP